MSPLDPETGSKVTLRSLLPCATSTLRVSGFQLESGMETTTVCVPTERLMFIGVVLRVSSQSTETLAPEGNEVTFNAPFCAHALLGISKTAPVNTVIQTIRLIHTILLGCVIESSLNARTVQLFCVNLTFVSAISRECSGEVKAITTPLPHLT